MPDPSAPSPEPVRLALVGVPNCGKTALFNLLTGSRQKVANYAGVTVERKEGAFTGPRHRRSAIACSTCPAPTACARPRPTRRSRATCCSAGSPARRRPTLIVCVVDATNLRLNLRLVLELRELGRPMIVALNMADIARERGFGIDRARLARELGCPVVETVAVRDGGERAAARAARGACRGRRRRRSPRWHDADAATQIQRDAARGAPHPARRWATRSPRGAARSRRARRDRAAPGARAR